jgi:hypothetical protein
LTQGGFCALIDATLKGGRIVRLDGILKSKRFWLSAAAIAVILLQDRTGLTPEQISSVVLSIGAWVVGDSLRPTDPKPEVAK